MALNLNQNNQSGDNNASLSNSGNENKTTNKMILKYQTQGFVGGIIISIIANVIYDLLIKWIRIWI